MPLLRLAEVSLAYGHRPLLDHVDLTLHKGERVCLVGRNGEGKSTLLRVVSGETAPDAGEVWLRPGMRLAHLSQEATLDTDACVFDVVAGGLPQLGELLSAYHQAAAALAASQETAAAQRLAELQHDLEAAGGWQLEQKVETVLSRLALDGNLGFATLSGGWRRRVMLARALVSEPDVLLLDEPTNHLDITAITWLEEFMLNYPGALLFVSHDRAFARRLATRIIELDRGRLNAWTCGYDDYLRRKSEQLEAEARQAALLDKKLAQEEVWIRQGIKARRTRNEGRVRALLALREQVRARRARIGTADLRLEEAEQSGQLVFEADDVSFGFGEQPVIRELSVRVMRGDRVGIIGPNGAGKSTLLKLLLGELAPTSGRIRRGTRLACAYFDQQRAQLDPDKSVMDNVAGGSEHVTVSGRKRHVAGYLRDFLFPGEQLRSPVRSLSGGERNRLLLARLFAQPANLLVLDEPTNDLDVETLELLEELVANFAGTLLLVSHDRAFLDNVVSSTLVFEGSGKVTEYVGGYSDWLRQRPDEGTPWSQGSSKRSVAEQTRPEPTAPPPPERPRKLSYKEQRELDALPARIEGLEAEQSALESRVNDPDFYARRREEVEAELERLAAVSAELETCYGRWEALEAIGARPALAGDNPG